MCTKIQFPEKSNYPDDFTDSKTNDMTTVELNKNGYVTEDVESTLKNQKNKKFNVQKILKRLTVGIGLFILIGLCLCILVVLIHKGYSTSISKLRKSSPSNKSTLRIFLNDKEKITACQSSKTLEDCCYILFGENSSRKEKCTVQKVLQLFLQYELKANKRLKRQYYEDYDDIDYHNQINDQDFFEYDPGNYVWENPNYDVPEGVYKQDINNVDAHSSNFHPPEQYLQSLRPYEFVQEKHLPNSHLRSFEDTTERTTQKFNYNQNIQDPKLQLRTPLNINFGVTSKAATNKCPDDQRTNKIETSTKITQISNLKAEPGKLQISFNDTKIAIQPEKRISQGNDFDMKPTNDGPSPKQIGPCFYPLSGPYIPPFTNYDPNAFFSMGSINQNLHRQPLYIINPPVYPPISMGYQTYQNPQIVSKAPIQVAGSGGQYYICNPVSMSTNNIANLQGVEVRRMRDGSNLQELVEAALKFPISNKTREAIDCPFGTRGCSDGSKCIHNRQVCDNEINCNDASDEINCSCKDRVGEMRWCDGYPDCPNNEDESNCFDCGLDEFSCDDWSKFQSGTCIPIDQRCDGIKQCEITGKDEEDCSILTDHLGQHPSNKVSNSVGFLHRNFKGVWYPTCFGAEIFSSDVCKTEAGPNDLVPKTHLVSTNDNYPGVFLDVTPTEGIALSNTCMRNQAAFVECPPIFCGLRLTITNPFRTVEVDTSVEEFLTRRKRIKRLVGDSRVVGGKASQPTSWPWVVSIYKNGVFHCGGVLINDLWILTAAHCVDKFWFFYYEIQAGILRRFSYSPMEQTRWATLAIPHENYNKKSLKNDIALMKLSKPVRFNRYVRPICLPSEATAGDDYLRGPKPNTICTTVGWGATIEHGADPDHLREVEIPILPQCKHTEDKEGDEICAGLLEGGRDACQGDSGGPLMCQNIKNRSQWYLAGIVSHGEGCARPNEPGVYTRVSKYIGWIQENINGKTIGRFPLQKCPGYVCKGTGRCLPKKRHCDKVVDCLLGDDEVDCWQHHTNALSSDSEIVGDSKIRGLLHRLWHIIDINDSSEEASNESMIAIDNSGSNSLQENASFLCQHIFQEIPFHKKCDRKVHCEDGTDESECLCVDHLKRFDRGSICDGVTDCKDLSDEIDCVKCPENEYLCHSSQKCIPLENRCDRKSDCINSEDEWDCVALTDGETLVLDSDLRPKQSMKGIITINRFGVWRPLCSNASVENDASIATNVCNLLGFEEYSAFHKLSVEDKPLNVTIDGFARYRTSLNETPLCGGLFVRCLNVSLRDNIHKLYRDNITSQVELNTSPWNAVIYFDGKSKCTGTILNSHFIIAATTCFPEELLGNVYISALLGKGKAHLDVEGPHEQIIAIEGVSVVNNTEAVLLKTSKKIVFNRYIHNVEVIKKSTPQKGQCMAIGTESNKSKVVLLKPRKKCSLGHKCFKVEKSYCKKTSQPWSGVITCNSRDGWSAVAIYSNINNICDLSKQEFVTVDKYEIDFAMGNDIETILPKRCQGFRCLLGNCIEENQICDGIPDCRNDEDEDLVFCSERRPDCHLGNNCTNFSHCKWSEFMCSDGSCIPKTSFCDTINDCKDLSDEPQECSCRTYLKVVHPEKVCDGKINCWDHSDEHPKNCKCQFPTNITCGQTKLCVSQEMLCDGFKDCPDGEDEKQCYTLKSNQKLSLNSGEVMTQTAGVWHSGCFTRNYTISELEEICRRLGFAGGSARQLMPSEVSRNSLKPVKDIFNTVWIRHGSGNGLKLQIRTGNEPYVKFVEDPSCYKLFIECL